MKIIYAKYNRHRLPQFRTETSILTDGATKSVVKKAVSNVAQDHIARMCASFSLLQEVCIAKNVRLPQQISSTTTSVTYQFVDGDTFSTLLLAAIAHSDKTQYLQLLDEFHEFLNNSFATIDKPVTNAAFTSLFGDVDLQVFSGQKYFQQRSFIDTVFDNVIISKPHYYIIDSEWYVECSLPVLYVFFRSIRIFYASRPGLDLDNFVPVTEVYNRYGFTAALLDACDRMEDGFHRHVFGSTDIDMLKPKYRKTVTHFSLLTDTLKQQDMELQNIINSRGWRVVQMFARWRRRLLPDGSRRARVFQMVFSKIGR